MLQRFHRSMVTTFEQIYKLVNLESTTRATMGRTKFSASKRIKVTKHWLSHSSLINSEGLTCRLEEA
jgi:hypothetical protein